MKYYNHSPKPDKDDGRGLCFICGDPTTGVEGIDLRHVGEEVKLTLVPRDYQDALHDCTAIVERALAGIPTERASDHERARVAVVALIGERYLRTRRAAPPKPRAKR